MGRSRAGAVRRGLLVLGVALTGCRDATGPAPLVIHIVAPSPTIESGFSGAFTATVVGADSTPRPEVRVTWAVADTSIAGVDTAGVVSGRRVGSTSLYASAGAARDSIAVTVVPAAVATLELMVPDSILHEGDSVALTAVAKDRVGRVLARPLTWLSYGLVSVNGSGVARGVAPGADVVIVSAGGRSAQANIYVERRYVAVTLGGNSDHTCALTDRAETFCWGDNLFGQLGDGTTAPRTAPVRVAIAAATSLAAGAIHTCALLSGGAVACWGANPYGALSQPATGPSACPWTGGTMPCGPSPVTAAMPFALTTIVGGEDFSCGLTGTGQAVCWGDNGAAQLGDSSYISRFQPDSVAGGRRFAMLTAGGPPACGLDAGGQAYCWGSNDFFASGQPSGGAVTQPTAVPTALRFRSLSAGSAFACGVTTGGDGYCWGVDLQGELGDGGATWTATPQLVPGGRTWSTIAAGTFHACGLTASHEVWCWGWLPGTGNRTISTPTHVEGFFRSVGAGSDSACGFGTDDVLYCWGRYPGNGSPYLSSAPVQVSGQYLR